MTRWGPISNVPTMRVLALAVVLLLTLAVPASAQNQCLGQVDAAEIEQKPGPPLRFGITPGAQTGQFFTGAVPPRTPEVPAKQLEGLAGLRAPGAPFVLRLHRFFWSDGEAGVKRFLDLADFYT